MGNIIVVVSVDWEGRSLLPENLRLMSELRRKHPDVPFQHFLNAAYYTRQNIDAQHTSRLIRDVLLPDDDHGLHIHAWRSLLSAAGVELDESPSLLQESAQVPRAPDDWGFYPPEKGYDTPLEHLSLESLDKIIRTSVRILVDEGFRTPTTFRAGAWMSGPKVQAALAKNGFVADCSAVCVDPVERRFGQIPLCEWLRQLWPTIDETSQPYRLNTPSAALWQVPNNANLVDYLSADETVAIFERNAARWRENSENNYFVSTGFHQETARVFLSRLDEAITAIKSVALQRRLPFIFTARPQDYIG